MSKIEISGRAPAITLKVNGVSIPAVAADLHLDAQSLPVLTVTIAALEADIQLDDADARLDNLSAETAEALGWAPPAQQAV